MIYYEVGSCWTWRLHTSPFYFSLFDKNSKKRYCIRIIEILTVPSTRKRKPPKAVICFWKIVQIIFSSYEEIKEQQGWFSISIGGAFVFADLFQNFWMQNFELDLLLYDLKSQLKKHQFQSSNKSEIHLHKPFSLLKSIYSK